MDLSTGGEGNLGSLVAFPVDPAGLRVSREQTQVAFREGLGLAHPSISQISNVTQL